MKVKIEGTEESVEVENYRLIDKGFLKAAFTLVEYPSGRKTIDCRHFIQGEKSWFAFPAKETTYKDKKEWIPLVSYMNKEYFEHVKTAVLAAIKDPSKESSYAKNSTTKSSSDQVQVKASDSWF